MSLDLREAFMEKFTVLPNSFLSRTCNGYFNRYYTGYRTPGNPDFINYLKNQFQSQSPFLLEECREEVAKCVTEDLLAIRDQEGLHHVVVVTVPRSKANMPENQMGFRLAVQEAVNGLRRRGFREFEDGTFCIERHTNTRTTHIRKEVANFDNSGDMPYVGITKATCHIDARAVRGKTVILIDDIYTRTVNIDEDCMQALYDAGAARVILYAVAYTKRR
jgi:amidophosphoribosyltransferase